MDESVVDIVTLRPHWSLSDLFGRRNEEQSKTRILVQLNQEYLSKGWELADDIHWSKRYDFAVMKIGRRSPA